MTGGSRLLIAGVAALAAVTALALAQESKSLSRNPSPPAPLPASGARGVGFGIGSNLGPVPQEGVLLLGNGEAIEGKISRVGELYYVALPGGQIRVKAAEVDFCCRSLDEAYQRKRASIRGTHASWVPTEGWSGDVHAHLRLAQWCLRHGLLGCAGEELAAALEADPNHPMIAVLERRLKMAVEPPPQHAPAAPADQTPSPEELDRLIRGMPPGAVETFTQTIQPLLVNHCGAAGCHGPQSQGQFRLLRAPLNRPASRRLTQRNLQAVLPWVNREDPAASPLLTAPIHPHGTAAKAVFGEGQVGQYQRMVDWVYLLAKRPAAEVPETVASKEQPPVRAMPAESPGLDSPPPKTPNTSDPQPADQQPADPQPADPQPAAGTDSGQQKPTAPASSVQRGAPLPVFVPVDPFDPEIFNRRYFGKPDSVPQGQGSD